MKKQYPLKSMLLGFLTIAIYTAQAQVTVSTFAGNGNFGLAEGEGKNAKFAFPEGIAIDGNGKFYIADRGNLRIRTITPEGVVGSFHNNTSPPAVDYPSGVAVQASGNSFVVYAVEYRNHRIRKITSAGAITTFAGTGASAGGTDGAPTVARLNNPFGIAIDAAGNVYVSDQGNHKIRKITAVGNVSTLAGSSTNTAGRTDGTKTAAQFNSPAGIVINTAGDVYVADFGNNSIRRVTAAGEVTTFAGSLAGTAGTADGIGNAAQFNGPTGLAIDATGNLYVTDQNNHRIRKITPAREVSTIAGSTYGAADGFANPTGIAVDASGSLYVANLSANSIRKISFGTLPLSWLSFTASASGNTQAKLEWRVEEKEVASYQAEQSVDGVNFSPVGALVSSKGNGLNSYFVTIPSANNTVYYRVYQKDQDGKGSYSSITVLKNQIVSSKTQVYPVPFNKTLTINSNKKQEAVIINVLGQSVLKLQLQQGENVTDVSVLASGVYYLKEEDGSVKKLVKD